MEVRLLCFKHNVIDIEIEEGLGLEIEIFRFLSVS